MVPQGPSGAFGSSFACLLKPQINPNGRIPALTDSSLSPPHQVFESAAILLWLIKKYDPEHKFSFSDEREASDAESWLSWGIGGLGPMQGQSNHL